MTQFYQGQCPSQQYLASKDLLAYLLAELKIMNSNYAFAAKTAKSNGVLANIFSTVATTIGKCVEKIAVLKGSLQIGSSALQIASSLTMAGLGFKYSGNAFSCENELGNMRSDLETLDSNENDTASVSNEEEPPPPTTTPKEIEEAWLDEDYSSKNDDLQIKNKDGKVEQTITKKEASEILKKNGNTEGENAKDASRTRIKERIKNQMANKEAEKTMYNQKAQNMNMLLGTTQSLSALSQGIGDLATAQDQKDQAALQSLSTALQTLSSLISSIDKEFSDEASKNYQQASQAASEIDATIVGAESRV